MYIIFSSFKITIVLQNNYRKSVTSNGANNVGTYLKNIYFKILNYQNNYNFNIQRWVRHKLMKKQLQICYRS